jgi:hypothetical protein
MKKNIILIITIGFLFQNIKKTQCNIKNLSKFFRRPSTKAEYYHDDAFAPNVSTTVTMGIHWTWHYTCP